MASHTSEDNAFSRTKALGLRSIPSSPNLFGLLSFDNIMLEEAVSSESDDTSTANVGTPTAVKKPASSSSGPVRMRIISPPSSGELAITFDGDVIGFCINVVDVAADLLSTRRLPTPAHALDDGSRQEQSCKCSWRIIIIMPDQ